MPALSLLVVGLGNPGPEYENTRHNVGFRVVDTLATRLDVSLERTGRVLFGRGSVDDHQIGMAKPLTYVNRSGDAVAALCRHYDVAIENLLIVVDDLHLPLGTLRLRPDGGSGGHNGLEHIAQRLGSTSYPRLRVGIGNDFPAGRQVDYVLSPFTADQEERMKKVVDEACDAILTVARENLTTAMNRHN